jgi:hypothetical protein
MKPRRSAPRHPRFVLDLRAVTMGLCLVMSACGVPGGGSVTRVDDADVPYRLLDPADTETSPPADLDESAPLVFWLRGERLVPESGTATCAQEPADAAALLLEALVAGPTEDSRADGWTSAITPESTLGVAGISGATLQVEVDPDTSVGAELLPVAVAQIVLTVTTAAGVDSVSLVSDGETVLAPLPDGVLTDEPVGRADYQDLLPVSLADKTTLGCR